MIKIYLDFLKIFTFKQKIKFGIVQISMIVSSLLSLVSVIIIIPFFNYLIQGKDVSEIKYLGFLNELLKFGDNNYLQNLSLIVLIILFLNTVSMIVTNFFISKYSFIISAELGVSLFRAIIKKNLNKFRENRISDYQSKIVNDIDRTTKSVMGKLLVVVNAFIDVVLILIAMLIYNFEVTVILSIFLLTTLIALTSSIKKIVMKNGNIIFNSQVLRMHYLSTALNAIKEITIFNKRSYFINQFKFNYQKIANKEAFNSIAASTPRYIFEFLIVGIILISIFIFADNNKELSDYITLFAIFGFATYKILPRFNQIYISYVSIKANHFAFENIKDELLKYKLDNQVEKKIKNKSTKQNINNITLKNISYKVKDKIILDKIDLKIDCTENYCVLGPSGSGKTTLLEIIMTLIQPTSGKIFIDKKKINYNQAWYNKISYVSQNIFLINDTILYNITFEEDQKKIDFKRLQKICKICGIEDWFKRNNIDYFYKIEDHNANISGGQKQRIGIARALYQNNSLLILDESTNSLDSNSEIQIIKNIISSKLTNIIFSTHNKQLSKFASKIINVKNKKVYLK